MGAWVADAPARYLTDERHLYRLIGSRDALKGQQVENVATGYTVWLDAEAIADCRVVEPLLPMSSDPREDR